MTLSPGTRLGRYEVRSQIGEGGMGEVYLVRDSQLGRQLALKILPVDVAGDQQRLHRFLQEARAASALSHPNVAHIYEIGEAEGAHFIAMEYVEGTALDKKISGRPLPRGEILDIAIQIADALDEAHSRGITHRDIKSSNIMITARGQVKVLDFGLAKVSLPTDVTDRTSNSELATRVKTSPGVVMGTVNYMSPEQALGREVDHRSDIFSFGVVLYEMATGLLPFTGNTVTETIDRITHTQPEAIARLNYDVPAELEVIIKKALRKDRDERYQTIHDLLLDLKELKRDADLAASLERSTPPASRSGEVPTEAFTRSRISSTSVPPAAQTTSLPPQHPTSSAEYIAGGIKRNKPLVIGVVAVVGLFAVLLGLSIAGYFFYRSFRPAENLASKNAGAPNMKFTRLTTNGKTENAAISPDGKTVVYVVRDGAQRSLWIRQVATSSNVQIVQPSEARIGRQTFSPDGNYVYYKAVDKDNPNGALFQVPALGGTPRKILTNIASPVGFSPDGNRITFMRDDSVATGETQLIVANVDGTNERKLAALKGDEFFDAGGPAWSPDGKMIACGGGTYKGGFHLNVYIVNAETGQLKEMTSSRFIDIGRVSWLNDGSGILVTAAEQGSVQNQIWTIATTGEARTITHDLSSYGGTSLTADSRSLVTVQYEFNSNVWIAPGNDLGHGKQITSGKRDGEFGLSWTPDNKVIYTSLASGNMDVWIMNADGSNQKQLTTDPEWDGNPAVSPDGRYIFFGSLRGNLPSIWRMNIDGGSVQRVTDKEDYIQEVTPDGQWIIFTSWRTGRLTLWKAGIDGSNPVQITDMFINSAAVSPDGKFLACGYFDEKPNVPARLIILPFEGGAPIKSFDMAQTFGGRPAWSADGKAIMFYDSRTGTTNVWSQPLDGGPLKQLTDFKSEEVSARAWSRDGKQVALARTTVTSDVILITNFR